jgi:branched-chain amino acid transport system substrate-binding protein
MQKRFRSVLGLLFILVLGLAGTASAQGIVVGRSLALTGALKSYGEAKRDGGDAYLKRINANGGIGGRPIEVVTLDDAYLPANIVTNLQKMAAENKPVAFLGLFGVPTSAAALPVLQELKIPAVGLSSGADIMRKPFNRYVFPVRASYADEARKLVSHAKTTGVTKIRIIYMDNPFGESMNAALENALKDAGLSATSIKIDIAGKEAAAVAAKAVAGETQAVFLATLAAVGAPLFTELKKAGLAGGVYGFSTLDATAVSKMLGASAAGLGISQVFPIPIGVRLKVVSEYLKDMKELGHGTPSFYGLEGYVEARVMVEGLHRAGSKPTPDSLVKALETMHDFDVGGYYVSYSPQAHNGSTFVEIDVINAAGVIAR